MGVRIAGDSTPCSRSRSVCFSTRLLSTDTSTAALHSDCWRGYINLPYFVPRCTLHQTVNHSSHFVDPITGAMAEHTATTFWKKVNRFLTIVVLNISFDLSGGSDGWTLQVEESLFNHKPKRAGGGPRGRRARQEIWVFGLFHSQPTSEDCEEPAMIYQDESTLLVKEVPRRTMRIETGVLIKNTIT